MSDYPEKRVDYINSWPQSGKFPAEIEYEKRCTAFFEQNGALPFQPLHFWYSQNRDYNIAISHIIDSLDMLPLYPHHAFAFMFTALDNYTDSVYPIYKNNTTAKLKETAESTVAIANNNSDVAIMLNNVLSAIPMQAALFLYKAIYEAGLGREYTRLTTNANNSLSPDRKAFIDAVSSRFGYDPHHFSDTIRKGASFFRRCFCENTVTINTIQYPITESLRNHLCLSGILYTMRNKYMHGDSVSSTKSSQTKPERYALNYYCFLLTYMYTSLLLIQFADSADLPDKNKSFFELRQNMQINIEYFRKLFGNHLS